MTSHLLARAVAENLFFSQQTAVAAEFKIFFIQDWRLQILAFFVFFIQLFLSVYFPPSLRSA